MGHNSNLARDAHNLYLVYSKKVGDGRLAMMSATSSDQGATWSQHVIAEQRFFPGQCFSPLSIFPAVAGDGAGGVYAAWVLINPETNRQDLFMAASKNGGSTWNKPVLVTDRGGTRLYPWIASDGPGRAGLAWFETNATTILKQNGMSCGRDTPANAAWYLHYAHLDDALADKPTFTDVLVQSEPVHKGSLGRPYAEVLQVRYTSDGHAVTAYVADVPQGKARPMFAIQTSP
jgi:hypothetical protein